MSEPLNGPCILHGKFDCFDCCPELYDAESMGDQPEWDRAEDAATGRKEQ